MIAQEVIVKAKFESAQFENRLRHAMRNTEDLEVDKLTSDLLSLDLSTAKEADLHSLCKRARGLSSN